MDDLSYLAVAPGLTKDEPVMLKDEDRIFTNIYGMHDRTLKGAQARGHWDGTPRSSRMVATGSLTR